MSSSRRDSPHHQLASSGAVDTTSTDAPAADESGPNADLRLASDPTTLPEALATLADGAEPLLAWQIAVNPNTPESVLHELWARHPLATLENPILAYQTLSTGKSFHELLPEEVKLALYDRLRSEQRHEELENHLPAQDRCGWLGYHSRKRESTGLPKDVLDSAYRHLATDASAEVRRHMVDNLPHSHLQFLTGDSSSLIRIALARKTHFSPFIGGIQGSGWAELVEPLSVDPNEEVRVIVAASTHLTPHAHERLAYDPSFAVKERLAKEGGGHNLREDGWRVLMAQGTQFCRLIAGNPACHESVRLDLTGHGDALVRSSAWNRVDFSQSRQAEKLMQRIDALFSDPQQVDERAVIAKSGTITAELIKRLMVCEPAVTRALAANRKLPEEDRAALLTHHDVETSVTAVENTSSDALIRLASSHARPEVRAAVAAMPGRVPSRSRTTLATDSSSAVRDRVCSYLMGTVQSYDGRNIREALAGLSRDHRARMRARVVADHRLPHSELPRLFQDPSVRVRLAMLQYRSSGAGGDLGLLDHKKVGIRVKAAELLLRYRWDESAYSSSESRISTDASPKVRAVAAKAKYVSSKVLQRLIIDHDIGVQEALTTRDLPRTRTQLDGGLNRCSSHRLTSLAASRNPYRRAIAASIYGAGKRRLRRLASDRCWFVRAMTAKNGHKLEPEVLAKLAKDPHPMVRDSARDRIRRHGALYGHLLKGDRA